MRRSVIVLCFFLIAAQRSSAEICEPIDSADLNILANVWATGAESLPVPTLEMNDSSAGDFQTIFAEAVSAYGRSLMANIHQQAIIKGEVLIDDIIELANELQWSIEMCAPIKGVCHAAQALDRIFKQFKVLLALSPGPGRPAQPPLPPIPVLNVKLHPVESALSLDSLFVNYNATLNNITSNILAYTGAIYLAGWNIALSNYDIYGLQARNEILNDKVLDVYRHVASQINYQCGFIEENVNPDLWNAYREAADRIETAWNAYQLYKSQVACIATF
ncbi:uncharacterized protein LOC124410606 [Diprion similis]|uniref:uncharacterized protein LOC124410606 n=1 Tax=Diprion similis TaxID=362088 RepID=UPI001EF872F8|nr:uncharacterized protein LOC124410606 [Diprion similis]